MEKEDMKKIIGKARESLNPEKKHNLRVKPWKADKLTRARDWFGSSDSVQTSISKYLNIPK